MQGWTHDGHQVMTLARWPMASGAKNHFLALPTFLSSKANQSINKPLNSTSAKLMLSIWTSLKFCHHGKESKASLPHHLISNCHVNPFPNTTF